MRDNSRYLKTGGMLTYIDDVLKANARAQGLSGVYQFAMPIADYRAMVAQLRAINPKLFVSTKSIAKGARLTIFMGRPPATVAGKVDNILTSFLYQPIQVYADDRQVRITIYIAYKELL